jgi:DNA-binding LytR/AlgR family response regulator
MMKCIIVDSHPQTVQSLKNYMKKVSFMEYIGAFAHPRDALSSLKNNPADLIFLEIRKSIVAGSPSFHLLHQRVPVILLSVNRKFAFDAVEHQATDFLAKPISFERFYHACEKAHKIKFPGANVSPAALSSAPKGGFIFVKEGTRLVRIELDEIYYVMGLKNYVSIYTKSQRIVSLLTMKEMEELLPSHRFTRVHRSYFIALDKIISVEKQHVHLKDKIIPVGSVYLPLFMKKLMRIPNR